MANSKIPYVNLSDTMNSHRLRFNQLLDSVGDVSSLTTSNKDVTSAINEHDAELGTITSVTMGTNASTVETAMLEVSGRLDSINYTQLSSPKLYVYDSNATSHIKGSMDIDTNLNVGGNLVINGIAAIKAGADGNIDLGDGTNTTDTVTFNANVASSIVPENDNLYDLGENNQEWRHGYFDGTVYADELQSDSATIGTLKVTDLTNNRVVIVGASDEIEDDANFTFDGTTLNVGQTSINRLAIGINTTGLEADSATITGDLDVGGNFTVDGNVDLGNASTDTVSINGQVDTDIVPSEGNKRSLGSGTNQWLNGYFDGTVNADELAADSATIGTLKVTDLTDGRIVIVGSGDSLADDANFTFDGDILTVGSTTIDRGATGINTTGLEADSGTIGTLKVTGLTNNRVVIAGTSGELEDDTNFTFDGDIFTVGSTTIDRGAIGINTTGLEADSATITADISVGGDLQVTGGFTVGGTVTFTGNTRTAASFQLMNDGVAVQDTNRAGLAIDRPGSDSAVIQWNELGNYWEAGVTTDLGRLALQGDSAQFLRVDGTIGSFDSLDVSADLDVTGNFNVDGITTLDSATVDGDLEVTGNFTVGGTTTFINTETVTIDDNIIVLNNNATGIPATNQDGGIEIERGSRTNVQLLWDESAKYWVAATDSTNTLSRIATANWIDATSPIVYNSSTGNISHANSTVSAGTYGSVTVDAKGHVTAGSNPAFDNYVSWTAADSAGDTYTITSGDTFKIKGDGFIKSDWSADDVLTIYHSKVGAASQNNSGGTFIQDVTMDSYGHVTAMGTGSVSNNTITISPRNGLKTGGNFTLNGSATTVYIDIDSAELRDEFIEKLVYDQITLNGPTSSYQGNLRSSNASFRLSDDTSDITNRPVSLGLMNTDTTLSNGAVLAYVNFEGENDAGERISYSRIEGSAVDVSDGTEDGQLELKSGADGTLYTGLDLNSGVAYLKSNDRLYLQSDYLDLNQARARFENTTAEANTSKPSYLEIHNNNPDPTDNMDIGEIQFSAENSVSNRNTYAGIRAKVKDFTTSTTDGELEMRVSYAGGLRQVFLADSNTSVLASKDIYLRPTDGNVYMQGTTSSEQLWFDLGTTTQQITASDALSFWAGTDIYLKPVGDDIFMQGISSGEQIQFNLGASKQTITSSDQMELTSGSSILFTTTTSVGTASSELSGGNFTLEAEPYNASYPYHYASLDIRHPRVTAATDGKIGELRFRAPDHLLGTSDKSYARIEGWDTQAAYPDEAGFMRFYVQKSGGDFKFLDADGDTENVELRAENDIRLKTYSGIIDLYHEGSQDVRFDIATEDTLKIYTGTTTLNSTFSGDDLTVQGDVTSISDVRTKENIETITDGLEIVDSLRGVRYNKIGKEDRKVGVIAQEVEEVLPEVINTDDEGMKSVDYGKMVGVLIEAIKDLKSEVDMLKIKLGE